MCLVEHSSNTAHKIGKGLFERSHLVIEFWWYSSSSWLLNSVDCLVQAEKGLLTSTPSVCFLTSAGANKKQVLQ